MVQGIHAVTWMPCTPDSAEVGLRVVMKLRHMQSVMDKFTSLCLRHSCKMV